MKLKVSSSLLLPQPPLPPCLLELALCVLRLSRCGQLQRRAALLTNPAAARTPALQQHKPSTFAESVRKGKNLQYVWKEVTAALRPSGEPRERPGVCRAARQCASCVSAARLETVTNRAKGTERGIFRHLVTPFVKPHITQS